MKIKEITIGKDYKISKNYNSIGASMSLTIELDENDNIDDVIKNQYNLIEEKCKEQLKFKGDWF